MEDEQREPFLRVQVLDLSLQPLVSMGQDAFQLQGHLAEKGDAAAVHGSWAHRGREGLVGQGISQGARPLTLSRFTSFPLSSGGEPLPLGLSRRTAVPGTESVALSVVMSHSRNLGWISRGPPLLSPAVGKKE